VVPQVGVLGLILFFSGPTPPLAPRGALFKDTNVGRDRHKHPVKLLKCHILGRTAHPYGVKLRNAAELRF